MFTRARSKIPGWNALGTGVLSISLVLGVLVAAMNDDGYKAAKVDLHDAGVWVTKRSKIARLNTEIAEFEVGVASASSVDVVQDGSTVYVAESGQEGTSIRAVNVTTENLSEAPIVAPSGASVYLAGGTLAVVGVAMTEDQADAKTSPDSAGGQTQLWFGSVESSTLSTSPEAMAEVPGSGRLVAVVDLSGGVHAYRTGARELWSFPAPGGIETEPLRRPMPALSEPLITAVGRQPVLVDRDGGKVVVVGGRTAKVTGAGTIELQQAGPESTGVLVSVGGRLLDVPLMAGSTRILADGGGEDPVAPVRAGGCAYGAWEAEARFTRICDHARSPLSNIEADSARGKLNSRDFLPGRPLTWRVNRERAVLNETETGSAMLADLEEPRVVRNWEMVDSDDEQEDEGSEAKLEDRDCAVSGYNFADLELTENPIERGTRERRPVVVPLIGTALVKADPCDTPIIELDGEGPSPDQGRAEVVEGGTAVQVTPAQGVNVLEVPFRVTSPNSEPASGVLRVTVHSENTGPKAEDDEAIGAAESVLIFNVLLNDTDPEGDPLRLVSVQGESDQAIPRIQPDGTLTIDVGSQVQPLKFSYIVEDDQGEADEGTLNVTVKPKDAKVPPNLASDYLVVAVGTRAEVDVLANDIDVDTPHSELRVNGVEPDDKNASLNLQRPQVDRAQGSGLMTLRPETPGEYTVKYMATDATTTRGATLRVKVTDRQAPGRPIAVRDQVSVYPGVPAVVDVLANDFDPDGDLLAVTSVDLSDAPGVAVEIIGLKLVRLIAPQADTRARNVRYTVSDGAQTDVGTIVMVPYQSRVTNQDPVAVDDLATVEAGQWLSVNVVENDIDPEGEELKVAKVDAPEYEGRPRGRVFQRGGEIRFRPNPDVRGEVSIPYEVVDPGEGRAGGHVVVTVVDPTDANRPPRSGLRVEGRARAGETTTIPFPLMSMDPDGDVVAILNVSADKAPTRGAVKIVGEGIDYTPERDQYGTDRFVVMVSDGDPAFDAVPVEVEVVVVKPSTDPLHPLAVPDTFTAREGAGERELDVLANDRDPDVTSDEVVLKLATDEDRIPRLSGEGSGKLSLRNGKVFYTPPPSIVGDSQEISFTYTVVDPSGLSAEGLVRVTINKGAVNAPPVAVDDLRAPALPGTTLTIDVLANDRDPDAPEFPDGVMPELLDPDSVPEARVLADGTIRVVAGQRSVKLAYQVTDADGATAVALVVVPVWASPAPVANPDKATIPAGSTQVEIDVVENDDNPGGDPDDLRLKILVSGSVSGGSATPTDEGNVVFTAGPGATEGAFSYVVENKRSRRTDVGRATVTVTEADEIQNRLPSISLPPTLTLTAGGPPTVWQLDQFAHDDDLPDDRLTFAVTARPGGPVQVTQAGNRLTVAVEDEDAPNFSGLMTVQVTDRDGASKESSVMVTVKPGQGPRLPVAVNDTGWETRQNEAVTRDVVGNDQWDATVTPVVLPQIDVVVGVGTAVVKGRSITFTPAAGYTGRALLRYTLTDNYKRTDGTVPPGRSSTATVEITVHSPPGRPLPPRGEPSSRTVSLTWDRPADNGLTIRGYVVEAQDVAGGTTLTKEATTAQVPFDGLTNGRSYKFRVAAWNDQYPSSTVADRFSNWSAPYTPNKVPDAPAAPQVRFDKTDNPDTGGVLHVQWSAPHNEGSEITGYTLSSDGPGGPWPAGASQTSMRVSGLANGVTYRFQLVATNAQGDSLPSPYSSADPYNSTPAGKPGPPVITRADPLPPEVSNSVGFTVVFSPGSDNGAEQSFEVITDGTPQPGTPSGTVVNDLSAGKNHTFTVKATNKAGETTSAEFVNRGYARAAAPTNVRITDEGDGQLTLAWDPVSVSGGNAVTYIVRASHLGDQDVGASTTFTDRGLTNGQPYTYQVIARNDGGSQFDSAPSASATGNPYGVPVVSNLSGGNQSQTSITWSWNSDSNGRPITAYNWTLTGVGSGVAGTTTVTTSGLSPGTTYRFCVTATNLRGPSQESCTSVATLPQPVITISWGGSAWGLPDENGGTCSSSCSWIDLVMTGYAPNSTYSVECWGDVGGESPWRSFPITTDSAGNASMNGSGSTPTCYFGYEGNDAWMVTSLAVSNRLSK